MTSVKFLFDNNKLSGFIISGHSSIDENDELGKIVCSAVSSAAYMAANTITDIIGDIADVTVNNAEMNLYIKNPSEHTLKVLEGFKLHIEQLSESYGNNIRINGGANNVKD